jgi:hypothetical protein
MAGADLATVATLAFRHLVVRRARATVLLAGYGLGAAVMMVLLSVGEAMLAQSRDVSLVGGGEVTVLPEGIDLEGFRTGSIGGMFFGIDRARFLERQLVGGARHQDVVEAASPVIEGKLLYLVREGRLIPIRASGQIPTRAAAVGAGADLLAGEWVDSPADDRFRAPTPDQLYDELDRFHRPQADSTWGEWHYFNVAPSADEWWYLTYLIGGDWTRGRGGGQLLVTRHRGGLAPARFTSGAGQAEVRFDTTGADLAIGAATVTQRDGRYHLVGRVRGDRGGTASFDLEVEPAPNAYFPPVELESDAFLSGYVVPAVRGVASGTLCENGRCRRLERVAAYHDHNWGTWRETTWDWGQARGRDLSLVYGGVLAPDSLTSPSASPYFLAAVDSLGVRQVLRFGRIRYRGRRTVSIGDGREVAAPEGFEFDAAREADTLRIAVEVRHVQATATGIAGPDRIFLQMRGGFRIDGRLLGAPVVDSGLGFFETFVRAAPRR